jgi:hydroxypyruvate isomerase
VKLLFDIYHMQIAEGDVIRTFARTATSSATFTPAAFRDATNSTTREDQLARGLP